jgi:sirohydrochlorin ferrochelatase
MVLRLREAGARPGQPVVLVAAGSADPCCQGDTARAARMLEEIWKGPVRAAHLTGRGERVGEVVAGFERAGVAAPAVAPYLLEPGEFHTRTRDDARALGLSTVADVLGDHPMVAEAVARRFRATVAHRFALSLA